MLPRCAESTIPRSPERASSYSPGLIAAFFPHLYNNPYLFMFVHRSKQPSRVPAETNRASSTIPTRVFPHLQSIKTSSSCHRCKTSSIPIRRLFLGDPSPSSSSPDACCIMLSIVVALDRLVAAPAVGLSTMGGNSRSLVAARGRVTSRGAGRGVKAAVSVGGSAMGSREGVGAGGKYWGGYDGCFCCCCCCGCHDFEGCGGG